MKRLLYLFLLITFLGCEVSTEALAEEIEESIAGEFAEKGLDIEVVEFTLIHKGGNDYKGFLEVIKNNRELEYIVEVLFDGDRYRWEIIQ